MLTAFLATQPYLHPVSAVPTWMSLSILASDFFAPGDLYRHLALAIHIQAGPGSSIPTSSSSYDHSFPSFQLPYPHITKFVRDSQGFSSSKPTVHLPAYPAPSWGPWTTLSAAPSISHIRSVFRLAESQCCGKAILHLLHPTPQPPDCGRQSHCQADWVTFSARAPITRGHHSHPVFLSQWWRTEH